MSAADVPALLDALDDRTIAAIDYSAHARRLILRIGAEASSPLRTLAFDGLVGLHVAPEDALAPMRPDETGEILRFDGKLRKTGEAEVTLVYRRGGAQATAIVSFLAQDGRWLG